MFLQSVPSLSVTPAKLALDSDRRAGIQELIENFRIVYKQINSLKFDHFHFFSFISKRGNKMPLTQQSIKTEIKERRKFMNDFFYLLSTL